MPESGSTLSAYQRSTPHLAFIDRCHRYYLRAESRRTPRRKQLSLEAIEASLLRFEQLCRTNRPSPLKELMTYLFEAGHLDQYKLRRAGPSN